MYLVCTWYMPGMFHPFYFTVQLLGGNEVIPSATFWMNRGHSCLPLSPQYMLHFHLAYGLAFLMLVHFNRHWILMLAFSSWYTRSSGLEEITL